MASNQLFLANLGALSPNLMSVSRDSFGKPFLLITKWQKRWTKCAWRRRASSRQKRVEQYSVDGEVTTVILLLRTPFFAYPWGALFIVCDTLCFQLWFSTVPERSIGTWKPNKYGEPYTKARRRCPNNFCTACLLGQWFNHVVRTLPKNVPPRRGWAWLGVPFLFISWFL